MYRKKVGVCESRYRYCISTGEYVIIDLDISFYHKEIESEIFFVM